MESHRAETSEGHRRRQVVTTDARPPSAGFGGFPGFPGGPTATNTISQAQDEFRAVLDDPKHTKAELQEKIAAVRKARQKARAELEAAQKDLHQMLTADQEAILVGLGYVE